MQKLSPICKMEANISCVSFTLRSESFVECIAEQVRKGYSNEYIQGDAKAFFFSKLSLSMVGKTFSEQHFEILFFQKVGFLRR